MYKLITVDLDGTLLNNDGIVTEGTKNIIKNVKKKGIDTILASGRPLYSIKEIAKEIESKNFLIGGNGAIIYDIQKGKNIYENCLNKMKILEICDICEKNDISYNIHTENTIIAKELKYNVLYYYQENLNEKRKYKTNITLVKDMIEHIKEAQNEKFVKVVICEENKIKFDEIIRKIKEVSDIKLLDVYDTTKKVIRCGAEEIKMEYYYTEISQKGTDKWNAIEYLIKKLDIKKEELIAIGDNINDKEMIKNAGLGIAMGQSMEEICKIADYITESNDEEGVKKAIEKYC